MELKEQADTETRKTLLSKDDTEKGMSFISFHFISNTIKSEEQWSCKRTSEIWGQLFKINDVVS